VPLTAPRLRRLLLGRPLASAEVEDTLLRKALALPIFASDALSSVAYATEAALVVLVTASAAAAGDVLWIAVVVAGLLAVVALSYRQTIYAYDKGGGAYVVARQNLGTTPGLLAAGALLIDYTLTVAVSVSAGILALTSAVPGLHSLRVELSLACLGALVLANLRGAREAGLVFALPTYGFVAGILCVIVTGLVRCAGDCPQAQVPDALPAGAAASVSFFVLLKAFASGSSALTGVEAIANGIPAFQRPKPRNAATTLTIMAMIAIVLFLGVSYLTVEMDAHPSGQASVLSQITRASFGGAGVPYYVVQGLTLAILVFAANTAFQGFPRLSALLARDRFMPRQFVNLGDRLVYSNGILILAGLAAALIVGFEANVNDLVHLYVVGVFTAFTLSQAGMVVHWHRTRPPGWQAKAAINGVGGTATALVTAIVIVTKFLEGAWGVILLMPLLVVAFYGVHRHYRDVGRRLAGDLATVRAEAPSRSRVLLAAESADNGLAAWYARRISNDGLRSVPALVRGDVPEPEPDSFTTAILPVRARRLERELIERPNTAIAHLPSASSGDPVPPTRCACRVLVAGAHAATLHAVQYSRLLRIDDTRALFFPFDEPEGRRVAREWARRGIGLELELDDAPYRDIAQPLLRDLRAITVEPGAIVVVVVPELIVEGWRKALHNRHAAHVRHVLRDEPRVIVTRVPYKL
jgi:amino acid transporter